MMCVSLKLTPILKWSESSNMQHISSFQKACLGASYVSISTLLFLKVEVPNSISDTNSNTCFSPKLRNYILQHEH
jgi:hypothetical protein